MAAGTACARTLSVDTAGTQPPADAIADEVDSALLALSAGRTPTAHARAPGTARLELALTAGVTADACAAALGIDDAAPIEIVGGLEAASAAADPTPAETLTETTGGAARAVACAAGALSAEDATTASTTPTAEPQALGTPGLASVPDDGWRTSNP